jgi:phage terminase small subunit
MPAELTAAPDLPQLTRRQALFALEVASDPSLTGADAARKAGCRGDTAKVTACRWLKMPQVKAEIQRLQEEILEREGVTRFSVLRELAAIGHSNPKDIDEALSKGGMAALTRRQAAAIKKFTIEEFEDKPAEQKGSTLEAQPQGGALQRGSDAQQPEKPRLKRRISVELLPKTPALELLGKNQNCWGASDPDAAAAANNVQVNVIIDL